ncbi:MAG: hypothetical protein Q7U54_18045 [Bacteroidales bacterium]|nr:hypothetical protein [Bacteroidales bacterium]
MLEIRTCLYRKDYDRADGKKQLKILAKVGDNSTNTFHLKKRYEIIILKDAKKYLVTDIEYERLKKVCEERLSLYQTEIRIKHIITDLLSAKVKINNQVIHDKLYELENRLAESENLLKWNELLGNYSEHEATNEDVATLENAMIELTQKQKTITDEDISDLFESIKFDDSREKLLKKIEHMSLNERYLKGHFDRSSIIEVFGYCWSTNLQKNEPYVADSYKSLILQITDYIYNSKTASPKVNDFNHKWVDNFLVYLIQKGYPKVNVVGYSPFGISKYYDKLKTAERVPYKTSSFQKAVKHLKQYINILQTVSLLPIAAVSVKAITPTTYLSRTSVKENYTRREHTLNLQELNDLQNKEFSNCNHALARDMFLIQVFAGGLRVMELYDRNLSVQGEFISIYRLKTKKITVNPILPELEKVLKRNNNQIPILMKESDYAKYLKEIAILMEWDRTIKAVNTTLDAEGKSGNKVAERVDVISVKDIFKPYCARKTIVNYMSLHGFSQEEIIEFTQHMDTKTLKHYKSLLSPEQKRDMVIEKLVNKLKPVKEAVEAA